MANETSEDGTDQNQNTPDNNKSTTTNSEGILDKKQISPKEEVAIENSTKSNINKNALSKQNKWKRADVISAIYTFINIVIAACSVYAVIVANYSYNLTRLSIESSNKKDSIIISINEKMSNAMIHSSQYIDSSFKETKKEFQIGNEPYLDIDAIVDVIMIESYINKTILIKLKIDNFGKFPVVVSEIRYSILFQDKMPEFTKLVYFAPPQAFNILLANGSPVYPITDTMYVTDPNASKNMYMGGYIKYKNLITNKIKKYAFEIEFKKEFTQKFYLLNDQDSKISD